MDRLTPDELRLIESLRRVPRTSPARAAPARSASRRGQKRSESAATVARRWAAALDACLPPPQSPLRPAHFKDEDIFSSSSTCSSPLVQCSEASTSVASVVGEENAPCAEPPPRKRLRLSTTSEVGACGLRDPRESASTAPVLRPVEPGETLSRTPDTQIPAMPYIQTWTRMLPDGRTLRVVNRVPRAPRYFTTEPRQPLDRSNLPG